MEIFITDSVSTSCMFIQIFFVSFVAAGFVFLGICPFLVVNTICCHVVVHSTLYSPFYFCSIGSSVRLSFVILVI